MGQTESVCISPQIPPKLHRASRHRYFTGKDSALWDTACTPAVISRDAPRIFFNGARFPGQQSENACHQREKKDISSDFSDIYNTVKDTGIYKFKFFRDFGCLLLWEKFPEGAAAPDPAEQGPQKGAPRRECTG